MRRHVFALSLVWLVAVGGCATDSHRQPGPSTASLEPTAGAWRTWVLSAGHEMRLPPPPDAAATSAELQELRALTTQRDAAEQERIRYWDFSSPSQRWNDVLTDINAASPLPGGESFRAFAMLNVRYEDWVREFGDSRLWAGIHFRSDITAGNEIGRQVGEAVVARAKADGA